MARIFVTGSEGFIGRNLLDILATRREFEVAALSRRKSGRDGAVNFVRGDLLDSHQYSNELVGVDAVIHLAAATGKVDSSVYTEVNVEGTRRLATAAKKAGVPRFVFVSSIAVKYPSGSEYPYAVSKRLAEEVVASCGVPYCIVRPTIVLGSGGAWWANLKSLASLPIIPVPGSGTVLIQPVHVRDVAAALVQLLQDVLPEPPVLELGGTSTMTLDDFLRRVSVRMGRVPRMLRVPLAPVLGALGLLEGLGIHVAPVSRGQLSAFRFDSVAEPHPWLSGHHRPMSLDAMLDDLLAH